MWSELLLQCSDKNIVLSLHCPERESILPGWTATFCGQTGLFSDLWWLLLWCTIRLLREVPEAHAHHEVKVVQWLQVLAFPIASDLGLLGASIQSTPPGSRQGAYSSGYSFAICSSHWKIKRPLIRIKMSPFILSGKLPTGDWRSSFPGRDQFCDCFSLQVTYLFLRGQARFSIPLPHVFSVVPQLEPQDGLW